MTNHVLYDLIERITGLSLDRGGVHAALDRFVTERMSLLGLRRIEDYITLVADPAGTEQRLVIERSTVQHTWFYRDAEQLKTIEGLLHAAPPGPLSAWVAGCATGEEAYTLAIIGRRIGRELTVLATDVSQRALDIAQRGTYSAAAVRDVPDLEKRWIPLRDGSYVVDPALRQNITFTRHNLVEPPPVAPRDGWDLIVCRNVLIYFSSASRNRLLERFARAVREGGSVVVGASEVVFEPPHGLELVTEANRQVLQRPRRGSPPILPRAGTGSVRAVTEGGGKGRDTRETPSYEARTTPRTHEAQGTKPREPQPHRAAPPPRGAQPPPPSQPPPPPQPPQRETRPQGAPPPAVTAPAVREDLVTALQRGHALFDRGDSAAAIPVYAELAERYPVEAEVWLFLGIAHFGHREYEAAAKHLRACLCLAPAMWPAGFYLARTYEELGQRAKALQQYELIAVDDLGPLTMIKSKSAIINEMNAFRGDIRSAARRVSADRGVSLRRLLNPTVKPEDPL